MGPSRLLFPILAVAERVDRAVRRIRPIRPGVSVACLEEHRHRGQSLTLADGTRIRRGDRVPILHFDNRRMREMATVDWQTRAYAVARDDLRALAARDAALPPAERPVAYTGATLLAVLTRRLGFELRARNPTIWVRIEDWYLRTLLARWAIDGRRRLARGRQPLVSQRGWLSQAELQRRWGPTAAGGATLAQEGAATSG